MSTQEIYNHLKVAENVITGGQPTEEQIRAAAEEGISAVINLATIDPHYSLKDEAALVRLLGMTYHHIPVQWQNPLESDFEAFEAVMRQTGSAKLLIHCAANYRVTAFYSLYAMKNLGWSQTQAREFRASIWSGSDYPVWESFIRQMEDRITGSMQEM